MAALDNRAHALGLSRDPSLPAAVAMRFESVSKTYPCDHDRLLLRRRLSNWWWCRPPQRRLVLEDVSFEIGPGEGLAVVGLNGAGKTTLLRLAAGITAPDRGRLTVGGPVAALMELGAGFHPDLTGVENIFLNAALLGLSRRQACRQFDRIAEFAELGGLLREPLRTYSSGMVLRLAFAVAIEVAPAIILIDEALAVGDRDFQPKCLQALKRLKAAGKTLVCVSHAIGLVRELCERALWLEEGRVRMLGAAATVLDRYEAAAAPVP